MEPHEILNRIYPLPKSSADLLVNLFSTVHHPKGQLIINANRLEKNIYLIKKGMVRAFAAKNEQEITCWFGQEGDLVISMNSYSANTAGYENIELLEDCELYKFSIQRLHQLYQTDIAIANWGRKLAELEIIKAEHRLISLQFKNAAQRYKELINLQPNLLQRVPLSHIASYLGITQVSLSRIRADLR